MKEELAQPLRVLQETARRIAKVSTESGIALVEEEYVQTFKVEMMDVVLQWCKGTKFADICKVSFYAVLHWTCPLLPSSGHDRESKEQWAWASCAVS